MQNETLSFGLDQKTDRPKRNLPRGPRSGSISTSFGSHRPHLASSWTLTQGSDSEPKCFKNTRGSKHFCDFGVLSGRRPELVSGARPRFELITCLPPISFFQSVLKEKVSYDLLGGPTARHAMLNRNGDRRLGARHAPQAAIARRPTHASCLHSKASTVTVHAAV